MYRKQIRAFGVGKVPVIVSILLLITLSLSGCSTAYQNGKESGIIAITFAAPVSRALTNSIASSAADLYEFVAYSPTGTSCYQAYVGSTATSAEIVVPIGTYSLIGLAGIQYGSTAYLVGSGKTSGIEVLSNQVTNIEITLNCVTLNLDVPASVTVSTQIQASLTFDTKLSELTVGTGYNKGYAIQVLGTSYNATYTATTDSNAGSIYSATFSFTAPSSPNIFTFDITCAGLDNMFINDGLFSSTLNQNSGYHVRWYPFLPYSIESIWNDYKKTTNILAAIGPTIGIVVKWGV